MLCCPVVYKSDVCQRARALLRPGRLRAQAEARLRNRRLIGAVSTFPLRARALAGACVAPSLTEISVLALAADALLGDWREQWGSGTDGLGF